MRKEKWIVLLATLLMVSVGALSIFRYHDVHRARNVVVFVWDGLRPDSVSKETTPYLYQLSQRGVWFEHQHASYPSFTMMNAASFATGDFAGKTGFYGNSLWDPQASGTDASGKIYNFRQPVFTEDYHLLQDLNQHEPLVSVSTLFEKAHQKGMLTAAVGKSGPAFFQDYKQGGIVLDEKHVSPIDFARYMQKHHIALPKNTVHAYPHFKLPKKNGDPTRFLKVFTLNDGVTADPTQATTSPYDRSNHYLMTTFLQYIWPLKAPRLSVVWLRNPDTTEHNYGVGPDVYKEALSDQDHLLQQLVTSLKKSGQLSYTDIIVVSDHGHSNVSGPLSVFPLRSIQDAEVGPVDPLGYSVSGDIRPAAMLQAAGFKAYDGRGCEYDPVLSGVLSNGDHLQAVHLDTDGSVCGDAAQVADPYGHRAQPTGKRYTTADFMVPKHLAHDALVAVGNGGSTYIYVPSHSKDLVQKVVRFFQSHPQFGIVFVDQQYRDIPGTFLLSQVHLQNKDKRNPDIIVGSAYNDKAVIQGMAGTEYNTSGSDRGMHGSFSPVDIHNTMMAIGPDFKSHFKDTLPTGNVDVAPTIAYILGLDLPEVTGRVLLESLRKGRKISSYHIKKRTYAPRMAADVVVYQVSPANGRDMLTGLHHYTAVLHAQSLQQGEHVYTYFDYGKALRY